MRNCLPSFFARAAISTPLFCRGSNRRPTCSASSSRLSLAGNIPSSRWNCPDSTRPGEEAAGLRQAFAVKSGDPVIAENVIKAGTDLQVALGEEGFALAEIGEQQIEIDHKTQTASLVLPVKPGPVARFGQISVSGQPPFPPSHIVTIARFDTGDRFKRSKVDDLRRALIATGLVA